MTTLSTRTIRPFRATDEDYAALVAANARVFTDYPWSVEEMRHEDAAWDHTKFFKAKLVLEVDGEVVGWALINHARHAFVADTYWLDFGVVPDARRHGHGTALFEESLRIVRDRKATRVRSFAKESMADGVEYLLHRGFTETKRDWESRLYVRDFDFAKFAGAEERVTSAGIRLSTLKDEMAKDPEAARKAYELSEHVHMDVPSADTPTSIEYDTWAKGHLEGPNSLLEAFFVAIDADGRWLGMSNLEKSDSDETFLWQGLTGVHREARGKGIAMALKLQTVRFAQARGGVDHIKTWNDQKNRPMLRINEAMGFVKQPAWIQFQKDL